MNWAGVDVDSRYLQIFTNSSKERIPNDSEKITAWLAKQVKDLKIGIEATGGYGQALADLAFEAGFTVYLLCPRWIARFRETARFRAKTDKCDAELICLYVEQTQERLHPYQPLEEPYKTLRSHVREHIRLARDRDHVKKRKLQVDHSELLNGYKLALGRLDQAIAQIINDLPQAQRLLDLPGVGPMVAAAALVAFASHPFKTKHAFVAYCGLDLAVHDSGMKKGRRYITNRGDETLRCLLYMAGCASTRTKEYGALYKALREEKGFSSTEAFLILGRKIAKRIFGVLHQKES